jgi:hypothetical protein
MPALLRLQLPAKAERADIVGLVALLAASPEKARGTP